jgi:hypothetical protein
MKKLILIIILITPTLILAQIKEPKSNEINERVVEGYKRIKAGKILTASSIGGFVGTYFISQDNSIDKSIRVLSFSLSSALLVVGTVYSIDGINILYKNKKGTWSGVASISPTGMRYIF